MSSLRQTFAQLSFTVAVLAFAASGYFFPALYQWEGNGWQPRQAIAPLVQVIMFGMGVSLTFADFGRVLKMPRTVLIGVLCQFIFMPLLAYGSVRLFGLQTEVAAGLILIGSCPGGVASNVIAYIAGANVPLSVTMTACSTICSPILTPLAMLLLAGEYVPLEILPMAWSIFQMILLPVLLGLLANQYASRWVRQVKLVMPVVAMLGICLIVAITIALARDDIRSVGLTLFLAVLCQNGVAYAVGYWSARCLGVGEIECRTIALEVGIQNGGMATGLAINVLHSPVIALGSAVYGPWSAITSSILATYWRSQTVSEEAPPLPTSPQA
ncbi:bile acid:sodium symporter family protein [Blastopirellula sp. J2-11]|uniref:bile acid:sodium symporter family protein n=1 Tax=Blastopirellula sp. J2-11 TaxID=2943192 RepID=UPI0021C5A553|nr:bile acid:sodium symporter family protein [Blastopirellula sp. J2-11]UUO06352.1 bile acid:sodium symporter family protein [Blastopirellula sp. J2-11]